MKIIKARSKQAFTLIELMMVVVVVLFVLAGLLIPATTKCKTPAAQISCVNNLRQVGLSFRMWAGDNGGAYPMYFKTNGFDGENFANQRAMYVYFQVMSNRLNMPKVLVCPADKKRTAATNFVTDFNSERVSYFVGLDAREDLPQTFLAGDRNLGEVTGEHKTTPPSGYGYSEKGGVYALNTNSIVVAWSDKMHQRQGNIALGDGSVQKFTTARMGDALRNTGLQTNRLVFP